MVLDRLFTRDMMKAGHAAHIFYDAMWRSRGRQVAKMNDSYHDETCAGRQLINILIIHHIHTPDGNDEAA